MVLAYLTLSRMAAQIRNNFLFTSCRRNYYVHHQLREQLSCSVKRYSYKNINRKIILKLVVNFLDTGSDANQNRNNKCPSYNKVIEVANLRQIVNSMLSKQSWYSINCKSQYTMNFESLSTKDSTILR